MGFWSTLFSGGNKQPEIDVNSLLAEGAVLVDVRTKHEFSMGGHIDTAVNVQYESLVQELEEYKDRTIILYCHSGARSAAAKRILQQAGFAQVINGGSLHRMRKRLEQ